MDEMDWLAEHEPEPAEAQDVQSELQQFIEREAKNAGLTIKGQKSIETDNTGPTFPPRQVPVQRERG